MSDGGRGLAVRYLRTLAIWVVACAGFWACAVTVDPDERQHLLGDSTQRSIDVVDVSRGDRCGQRKETYTLTYRFAGETEVHDVDRCRKQWPPTGPQEVWLTDGGEMKFDSPQVTRAWAVAAPFLLAGLFTYFGTRMRRHRSRD